MSFSSSPRPSGALGITAGWVRIPVAAAGLPPCTLRCWWARPAKGPGRAGILVLPEVFGVNGWVRSVADRLAAEGFAALAMPLFARTAPALELGYGPGDLAEGRSHKERTSAAELLADVATAASWIQERMGASPLGCVGFCFGGHVAMLAATLPSIAATCDFYGAGVATGRPGGGSPTLDEVARLQGTLLCFCGTRDPLIPAVDREAIAAALADTAHQRHRLVCLDAGHGFMCEERGDFDSNAAAVGWREMLTLFARVL